MFAADAVRAESVFGHAKDFEDVKHSFAREVDDVHSYFSRYLFNSSAAGDELVVGWHVNAEHAAAGDSIVSDDPDGRRVACKGYFLCSAFFNDEFARVF